MSELGEAEPERKTDDIQYKWVHPDYITYNKKDRTDGYIVRNWASLNITLDTYTFTSKRNFHYIEAENMATTYKIEEAVAAFDAMPAYDKKAFCAVERRMGEIAPTQQIDGHFIEGHGTFANGDTILNTYVDNFEGEPKPWYAQVRRPRQWTTAKVCIGPLKQEHGRLSIYDSNEPRITLPMSAEIIQSALAEMNASSHPKRILLNLEALLFKFEFPSYGPDEVDLDNPPSDYFLFPKQAYSVPVILNSFDLVVYKQEQAVPY